MHPHFLPPGRRGGLVSAPPIQRRMMYLIGFFITYLLLWRKSIHDGLYGQKFLDIVAVVLILIILSALWPVLAIFYLALSLLLWRAK